MKKNDNLKFAYFEYKYGKDRLRFISYNYYVGFLSLILCNMYLFWVVKKILINVLRRIYVENICHFGFCFLP
jgi:hypothetical protein